MKAQRIARRARRRTTLTKETAGAFWYRSEEADGRILTITVPKTDSEQASADAWVATEEQS